MNMNDRKQIRIWYWSGAALVFLILVVGGVTRLTDSGLSMVEWKPLMGVIPPMSEEAWQDTFEMYKQYPEYQQRNAGMELSEFKYIFFWEYLHRILGRMIGIVFIIPFGWFLVKKKFNSKQLRRDLFLLLLGTAQGFMGWYMVKSGLADVPYVSHYRLAAHLSLAFIIFGSCVLFALDLYEHKTGTEKMASELKKWLWVFLILIVLQIVWGAFVAGLNAGHVYNTFPKMFGSWIPSESWTMEPLIRNLTDNPAATQLIHRILATVIGFFIIILWLRVLLKASLWETKKWTLSLFAVVLIQYALGVFTLIYHVPVWLGVTHQAVALILTGLTLGFMQFLNRADTKSLITND